MFCTMTDPLLQWHSTVRFTRSCLNPLTTKDEYTHHAILAACYQLEPFVLKIGFVVAKMGGTGEGGQA